MTIDVIVEQKRLVLSKIDKICWQLDFKGYRNETPSLQEWLDYFEKDKDYTWTIEYVTADFIIMIRKKWKKQSLKDLKKELEE